MRVKILNMIKKNNNKKNMLKILYLYRMYVGVCLSCITLTLHSTLILIYKFPIISCNMYFYDKI
jgi:hypothetical protein